MVCAVYYLPDTRTPRSLRLLQKVLMPFVFCHKCSDISSSVKTADIGDNEVYTFNEGVENDSHADNSPPGDRQPLQRESSGTFITTGNTLRRTTTGADVRLPGVDHETSTKTSQVGARRRTYLKSKGLGVDNLELVNLIDRCVQYADKRRILNSACHHAV